MFDFEESITMESIQTMIDNAVRKWIEKYFDMHWRDLNLRMTAIETNLNSSPAENLIGANDTFLSTIKPVMVHIRDYEQKIYKEMKEIRKEWAHLKKIM